MRPIGSASGTRFKHSRDKPNSANRTGMKRIFVVLILADPCPYSLLFNTAAEQAVRHE